MEALQDSDTHLTHPALASVRKQSVQDVERLFCNSVIDFMERKGYEPEIKFLRAVRNWTRAIDERGLEEIQRQKFPHEFKIYICDWLWEKGHFRIYIFNIELLAPQRVEKALSYKMHSLFRCQSNVLWSYGRERSLIFVYSKKKQFEKTVIEVLLPV